MTAVCTPPDVQEREELSVPAPPDEELERLASAAPLMTGAEYLSACLLGGLWEELGAVFAEDLAASVVPLQPFLKSLNLAWNLVGRVHFNLAENRRQVPEATSRDR